MHTHNHWNERVPPSSASYSPGLPPSSPYVSSPNPSRAQHWTKPSSPSGSATSAISHALSMHALPITPRSSLDRPSSPPTTFTSDVAKVVLADDPPILAPAIEEAATTPKFLHPHTPPPSPPKPPRTPAKPPAPIKIPPRMLKNLKHFLDREHCSARSLRLKGASHKMLKALDGMKERGELYGWGSQGLRLSLFSGTLILEYPTRQHEFITRLFKTIALPSGIVSGGADDITLFNGTKTPDYCLYDARHPPLSTLGSGSGSRRPAFENFPTVTFEVAFSQKHRRVGEAAARTIGGSFGAIQLVVAIKLQYATPQRNANGVRPPIETAVADYWVVVEVEELGPDEYKGPVNCLLPADGPLPDSGQQYSDEEDDGGDGDGEYVDDGFDANDKDEGEDNDGDADADADTGDEDDRGTPIPTAYRYVMRNKDAGDGAEGLIGGFSVLHIHCTETYTILPEAIETPGESLAESPASASPLQPPPLQFLDFYYSQLFHGECPPYVDETRPLLRIPYQQIRSVLREAEEQQAGDDLFRGTKRRRGFLGHVKIAAEKNKKRLKLE